MFAREREIRRKREREKKDGVKSRLHKTRQNGEYSYVWRLPITRIIISFIFLLFSKLCNDKQRGSVRWCWLTRINTLGKQVFWKCSRWRMMGTKRLAKWNLSLSLRNSSKKEKETLWIIIPCRLFFGNEIFSKWMDKAILSLSLFVRGETGVPIEWTNTRHIFFIYIRADLSGKWITETWITARDLNRGEKVS